MARKRENEDLKLDIREKNGKFYAYRSTSGMVNGRKATLTEYLGTYDPVTGAIKEKRVRGKQRSKEDIAASKKEMTVERLADGLSIREYGAVRLLDHIQRRSNIGLDLTRSFGTAARAILCSAFSLTLGSHAFMNIEDTMDRTMIREIYGMKGRFDSVSMSEFTHSIGGCTENMDEFYRCRVNRCGDMLAWDTTTKGTYSALDGLAEWAKSKDLEDIQQIKKAIATDRRGIPVLFDIYPGTLSDIATVDRFVERVKGYGRGDLLMVMDRGFGSGSKVHHLNEGDVSFVLPANTGMRSVKKLLTDFGNRKNERRLFDGHAYDVWCTQLALVPKEGKFNVDGEQMYAFVGTDEAPKDAERVNAFVCYDSKKYSDELQSIRLIIGSVSDKLAEIDSNDPMKQFRRIAGKARKYFDAEADGRELRFGVKNNAVTFAENRAGLFVMLSSKDIDWETMMAAYDARRLVEQSFDFDKTEDRRFRTGDRVTMMGREFIRFVSLMIRCEIAYSIRKNKDTLTVDGVLNSLSNVMAVGKGEEWVVGETTKKCRELFEYFGIERTKVPLTGIEVYDLADLLTSDED